MKDTPQYTRVKISIMYDYLCIYFIDVSFPRPSRLYINKNILPNFLKEYDKSRNSETFQYFELNSYLNRHDYSGPYQKDHSYFTIGIPFRKKDIKKNSRDNDKGH